MPDDAVKAAQAVNRPDLGYVGVVIPALNEERSLAELLPILAGLGLGQVVVGDNGSTDGTTRVVNANGFDAVFEPRRGYGAACAAAIAALQTEIQIVVFIDADLADDPRRIVDLVVPIQADRADLVIGYRDPAMRAPGSMSVAQRFGNWLATRLIRLGWGMRYHDLGPFRAIARSALDSMQMRDRAYGWTVEMQVRAVQMNLRIEQIPVAYRKRVGVSKISGTIRGVCLAGYYILTTIARLYFRPPV
jgi:glycosyltransferase involved in cell wall biosynthesis